MADALRGTSEKRDYVSYLLRLWRDGSEKGLWRASVEDPRTGERRGFADLEALFEHLRQSTGLAEEPATEQGPEGAME